MRLYLSLWRDQGMHVLRMPSEMHEPIALYQNQEPLSREVHTPTMTDVYELLYNSAGKYTANPNR
jgi:hypothetical protein